MKLRSFVPRPLVAAFAVGLAAAVSVGAAAPQADAVAFRDYRCRHLEYTPHLRMLDGYDCTPLFVNHEPMDNTLIMKTGGRRWLYECEIVKVVVGSEKDIVGAHCKPI
ncbi:hypothetical protein [Streptomyces cacaoi]|uniref:Secreted protein n=1 Tax=Streptomyces cacaoi TaxID=1898 RepID=A0A4Y3QSE4_STRCI|nr:hypothetical protein [Streptomyces cacaoi]NNG85086.1 hypothetical protein [Streptomyces cacaoi]GEB48131.1 hypothetical protein SCA03_06820 [Streptomyces cacaoi]